MAGGFSTAIEPQKDLGGAISYPVDWIIQEAGQTSVSGVPVQINATDGGVQLWDGSTIAAGIAGISVQAFDNLGTTGAGFPNPYSPILGPGSVIGNYRANANQPLAVITPSMVPMVDGGMYFIVAGPEVVFSGAIGSSSGSNAAIATNNNQVGLAYGLTADGGSGNPFYFVDANKTGGSAVLRIVGIDPRQPVGTVGGQVLFVILPASAQIPV